MKNKRMRGLFLLVIGLMLILSACGGGGKKNIAIGPAASETNNVSKLILKAYGIEDGDYKRSKKDLVMRRMAFKMAISMFRLEFWASSSQYRKFTSFFKRCENAWTFR